LIFIDKSFVSGIRSKILVLYVKMKPIKINKTNTKKIFSWCKSYYGESRFNKLKSLKLVIDNTLDGAGQYEPISNTISVNLKEHKEESILFLIDTMIHEYTHFKQDIKVMYWKYYDVYRYNEQNHPHEITAKSVAKRDKWLCYRQVFGSESNLL
jgi:hypothetical protein